MTKTLLAVVGTALVVGVGIFYLPSNEVSTVKEEVIEFVKEEDGYGNLDKLIKEAQASSSDEINTKIEAYREELLKEIEDDVKAKYILEIEKTITKEAY